MRRGCFPSPLTRMATFDAGYIAQTVAFFVNRSSNTLPLANGSHPYDWPGRGGLTYFGSGSGAENANSTLSEARNKRGPKWPKTAPMATAIRTMKASRTIEAPQHSELR